MGYHYDPILCMNVPDSTSKAKDANKYVEAAAKMLKEGKSGTEIIFALQRMGLTPVDAAQYYGEAKLSSPRAYDSLDKAIDENYIVSGMKSQLGQMLKRYKDLKNRNQLVSQYIGIVNNHRANGKVTEEEFNEFVKYAKGLVGGSHDSLDRAIRTADKFTVWESDEYDDIYVSYEGGTYVLYVEGRPQADGPQQRMIQLAKQEERMRD